MRSRRIIKTYENFCLLFIVFCLQDLIDAVKAAYLDDVNTFGYSFETAAAGKSNGSFKNLLGGFKKKAASAKAKAIYPPPSKAAASSLATAANEAADPKIGSNLNHSAEHGTKRASDLAEEPGDSSIKRSRDCINYSDEA
jgi:hypothetical protein